MLAFFALALACGDDAAQAEAGVGTPPPPGTTTAPVTTGSGEDTSATTTGPIVSGCDCAPGQFCAAPHRAGVTDPQDERLIYACGDACVPENDASQWCRPDVASCCGDLECDAFGYCVGESSDSTASGSTTGQTDTGTSTTDATTGTTDATTTGTESSSGDTSTGSSTTN